MRGLALTIEGRNLASYGVLGLRGFTRLLTSKLHLPQRAAEFAVTPPGLAHPVWLRTGTSDVATFMQIFQDLEYQLDDVGPVKSIIDAGANIGLSAVFFAHRYPSATVVAIEPEESNFRFLERNASPYRNILPVQAALWNRNGSIELTDPGVGKWGFQVQESGARDQRRGVQRIAAVTVDEVMERAHLEHVDILKMDIEGAEKEVLEASYEWIDKVGVMVVELHDRFKPGCSRSFYNATNGFDTEWRRGEHVFVGRSAWRTKLEVMQADNLERA